MNFGEYVHDKALTISNVSAKIDVRKLVNFLQNKKDIKELNLINVEVGFKDVKELGKLTHLRCRIYRSRQSKKPYFT